MSTPTRLTKGLSTQVKTAPLGDYPLPSPFTTSSSNTSNMDVFYYQNDYTDLDSTVSRTITGVSSTFALVNGVGGIGVLTPGAAATVSTVARTAAAFQFVAGQKFWYVVRASLSGVGAGVIADFGLQMGNGANTTNDALYFTKVTAAGGGINLVSTVATVATTIVTNVIATTTAATFVDLALYYNGLDLLVFANGVQVARVLSPTFGTTGTTLSSQLLQPFYQITPVASETISIDYELAAQETVR